MIREIVLAFSIHYYFRDIRNLFELENEEEIY